MECSPGDPRILPGGWPKNSTLQPAHLSKELFARQADSFAQESRLSRDVQRDSHGLPADGQTSTAADNGTCGRNIPVSCIQTGKNRNPGSAWISVVEATCPG